MTDPLGKTTPTRLSEADEAFLARLEHEDSLVAQVGATLAAPYRWLTLMAAVMSLVGFIAMLVCIWQLQSVASLPALGLWLAGFVFAALVTVLPKLWLWLRMNHLAVMRDLRRVELHLSRRA
jgi:hypothetical protein